MSEFSPEDAPRPVDLVAFDVDGTLIREDDGLTVWEVLNREFVGDCRINRERHRMFLDGKLSYAEWVALDIGGWQAAGATRERIVAAFASLAPIDGARPALDTLAAFGVKLVVISGTLDLLLETLLPDAPFDEVYCNHIGFDEFGRISHWAATPFDNRGKEKLLRAIALREGIPLERCGFVGDSTNDRWIARAAGLSVALNPRCDELERAADVVLRARDLRDVLPCLLGRGS
ncbi:MAG TPA: HAD-IB family phosphatase [Candidatus Polarisedimenticolaceae bacterium]|nr:HAD-IB family phosphatase [Candidatus Polarisedimenticolaceae bacterium]